MHNQEPSHDSEKNTPPAQQAASENDRDKEVKDGPAEEQKRTSFIQGGGTG